MTFEDSLENLKVFGTRSTPTIPSESVSFLQIERNSLPLVSINAGPRGGPFYIVLKEVRVYCTVYYNVFYVDLGVYSCPNFGSAVVVYTVVTGYHSVLHVCELSCSGFRLMFEELMVVRVLGSMQVNQRTVRNF